jgi:hypothetical protein
MNVVGAYLAMFCCNIWPRQTWLPLAVGTIIEPVGIIMIAVAIGLDNKTLVFGMLGLAGVGTGIRFMPGPYFFPESVKHSPSRC